MQDFGIYNQHEKDVALYGMEQVLLNSLEHFYEENVNLYWNFAKATTAKNRAPQAIAELFQCLMET